MNLLILIAIIVVISLVWDMKQTLKIKLYPDYFELNRIMGKHPSDATVKLYFAFVISLYLTVVALRAFTKPPSTVHISGWFF